jgi:hypothetical protein
MLDQVGSIAEPWRFPWALFEVAGPAARPMRLCRPKMLNGRTMIAGSIVPGSMLRT